MSLKSNEGIRAVQLPIEKSLKARNLLRLIVSAEKDVREKRVRSMRSFLKEFENARNASR